MSQRGLDYDSLDIPLDVSDILSICRNYVLLGWQLQQQAQYLAELGVDEAIKSGLIKPNCLPSLKDFYLAISNNVYLGDAALQARDYVEMIESFEERNPDLFNLSN